MTESERRVIEAAKDLTAEMNRRRVYGIPFDASQVADRPYRQGLDYSELNAAVGALEAEQDTEYGEFVGAENDEKNNAITAQNDSPDLAVEGGGPYKVYVYYAGERAYGIEGPAGKLRIDPPIRDRAVAQASADDLNRATDRERQSAYSQGFTAGRQDRSDGGEAAAAKSHDYPLVSSDYLRDALVTAWGLICNGKAWDDRDTGEWAEARNKWRDEQFHPLLELLKPAAPASSGEGEAEFQTTPNNSKVLESAPDGEGPYRVELDEHLNGDGIAHIIARSNGGDIAAQVDDGDIGGAIEFIVNAAFTAGQQHRSDCGEVAALKRLLEGRANDEMIEVCTIWNALQSVAPASYGDGEPEIPGFEGTRDALAALTARPRYDDVVKDAKDIEDFIVACRSDDDRVDDDSILSGVLVRVRQMIGRLTAAEKQDCKESPSSSTVSPDLVDAIREYKAAATDVIDGWVLDGGTNMPTVDRYLAARANLADALADADAALQNTPQPDESEAVKLLREYRQWIKDNLSPIADAMAVRRVEIETDGVASNPVIGEDPATYKARQAWIEPFIELTRRVDTFLSNTPEVDR